MSVASVEVFNGTILLGHATVDNANHAWTLTATLSDGAYAQLKAVATDGSGNTTTGNTAQGVTVDSDQPQVTSIDVSQASGTLHAGDQVTFTVRLNDAVSDVATGSHLLPTLSLNDGGTATFDTVQSTPTAAVFDYTVQAGDQSVAQLQITGFSANGADLQDLAGNSLQLPSFGTPLDTGLAVDTNVNEPPVLALNNNGSVSASEQVPVALAPALTLSDVDSTTLASAKIQITGNYANGEDVLSFTDTSQIHGNWDAGTGTLTLTAISGQTPIDADYQTALSSVTYTDTSNTPSIAPRTVTFTVQDPNGTANGGHDTATATATINLGGGGGSGSNFVQLNGFDTTHGIDDAGWVIGFT